MWVHVVHWPKSDLTQDCIVGRVEGIYSRWRGGEGGSSSEFWNVVIDNAAVAWGVSSQDLGTVL